ncbi:MAG TPA: class E sortase [Acidimicrobiales bacterium]|nr:class E sortase [Acidimicrobiales bacterium]
MTIVDRILTALAERPGARRGLTAAAVVLLVAALGMLSYPVITDLYHNSLQGRLGKELTSPSTRQAYLSGSLKAGQSLTRLQIPKLGVNVVVVQGIDDNSLRAGAGHYPETPLPCEVGDVAIAGHRTTYGKPFANVDRLSPGDRIVLTTPVGSCIYQVAQKPFVVLPDDWQVVSNTPGQFQLTLTACHPKGSASHRIVIKAVMISSTASV